MDVAVLGARGTLGKLVCSRLAERGHRVIVQPRGEPIDKADAIVHCAGASVALGLGHGWHGYRAVDVPIGLAAVAAARRHGARLVYVAAHHAPALRGCAYIAAHERVAEAMRDVDGCVVRATGFFAVFASLLAMARRGWLVDVGDGRARTNPIGERDLAAIVADAATGSAREVA
ncbi:MAG: SDR family oxidoreductase, partial [Acidobacteriota bacterium]